MAYPQQPGFQYGPPMPYGYWGPKPPSRTGAAISAVLFIACAVVSGIIAIAGWSMIEKCSGGSGNGPLICYMPKNVELFVATIGQRFDPEAIDLGWPWPRMVTMVIAVLVLVLALALLAGADAARWLLAIIAVPIAAYYVYVLIYLFTHDAGEFTAMVFVALIVWLAAVVVVFLPPVSRGMTSYRRKWAFHVQGQQPQQPGAYGRPGPAGQPGSYGQQY